MEDLFSDHPEASEPSDGIALWHRATRRERWKRIGTGKTLQEILAFMDQAGSGEFVYLPIGQKPGPAKQL